MSQYSPDYTWAALLQALLRPDTFAASWHRPKSRFV